MERTVYVAVMNGERVTLYGGELVENNLVEIGNLVSNYKTADKLPNWLRDALPAAPARDGELESLASEVAARNSWREPLLCFMELAPVLPSSGLIDGIGKIKEWRVGLSYGRNLDDIECGFNYFGETPEEAIEKARAALAAAKEQADGQ